MGCACLKSYDAQFFMSGVPADARSGTRDGSERKPQLIYFDEFDEATRLPNLMIELRQIGYVEISGKNHMGVCERLGTFLQKEWGCTLKTNDEHPICDFRYDLPSNVIILGNNQPDRDHRENNMGRLVLQLVSFMSKALGWSLAMVSSSGVSPCREAQIKFKAPNPLNLLAPHMMLELRSPNVALGMGTSDGFIEMNLSHPEDANTKDAVASLGSWVRKNWGMEKYEWKGAQPICDMKVATKALKIRGLQGENNIGMRTMELADFMCRTLGWSMITCDLGGDIKREQQIVFRWDQFKAKHRGGASTVLMVELRQLGYVEVSGQDSFGAYDIVEKFVQSEWKCRRYDWGGKEEFCQRKYTCPALKPELRSLTHLAMQLIDHMQERGWTLFILNGGELNTHGGGGVASGYGVRDERFHGRPAQELQVKFMSPHPSRPALPILLLQLRANTYQWGRIMISGKDCEGVYEKLDGFITGYLESKKVDNPENCKCEYICPVFFLSAGNFAGSNLAHITMRFVDLLEDHIGGWDLVACSSHHPDKTQVEQLLAFRYSGMSRMKLRTTKTQVNLQGSLENIEFPEYWRLLDPGTADNNKEHLHETGRATMEERKMLQTMLDETYKAVKTRDREGDLPTRLTIVEAVVSEHIELYRRFSLAREAIPDEYRIHDAWRPITHKSDLAKRNDLSYKKNEAYVMHGTQPSSALSILQNGFSLDLAGEATGTMFGKGIYCAERSSKADEYAKFDEEHPRIMAMVVCRAACGRCFVVNQAGDYTDKLASGFCETILGDRETVKGTFREFVIGHADRLYPEYAVMYVRSYDTGPRAPTPIAPPSRETPNNKKKKKKSLEHGDDFRESPSMLSSKASTTNSERESREEVPVIFMEGVGLEPETTTI